MDASPSTSAPQPSPFVARLDEWRRTLGMDHRQFAAHLGVHEAYWSQLRHGKRGGGLEAKKLRDRVRVLRPDLVSLLVADLFAA